jgi:hypothetical protein
VEHFQIEHAPRMSRICKFLELVVLANIVASVLAGLCVSAHRTHARATMSTQSRLETMGRCYADGAACTPAERLATHPDYLWADLYAPLLPRVLVDAAVRSGATALVAELIAC